MLCMKSTLLKHTLLLLAAVMVVGTSCRKIKQSSSSTTTTVTPNQEYPDPDAGYGGTANFKITAVHDTIQIDSCLVYVKFNTSVIAADSTYDDSAWAAVNRDGVPQASFYGLKPGDYYFYIDGWDIIRSEKVSGGLFYTILNENKATTHLLTVPVEGYE